MASLLRLFSYEEVGKSFRAEIRYCPNCRTEKTIDFRKIRYYFSFLRIPIYPVSDSLINAVCLSCRCVFKEHELEAEELKHNERSWQRLYEILAIHIPHHGASIPSDLQENFTRTPQQLELSSNLESFDIAALKKQLAGNSSGHESKTPGRSSEKVYLEISRKSDELNQQDRNSLLWIASVLDYPSQELADSELKKIDRETLSDKHEILAAFATAIGMGQPESQKTISLLLGEN